MEFKQKCQGQTDYMSNLGEIATSKLINEPHAIAKDKADYHLLVIVFGVWTEVEHTAAKEGETLDLFPQPEIGDLFRNHFDRVSCD